MFHYRCNMERSTHVYGSVILKMEAPGTCKIHLRCIVTTTCWHTYMYNYMSSKSSDTCVQYVACVSSSIYSTHIYK